METSVGGGGALNLELGLEVFHEPLSGAGDPDAEDMVRPSRSPRWADGVSSG